MRASYTAHRWEAKASAPGSGSEERIEDAFEIFLADAASIVRNFDDRFLAKFAGTPTELTGRGFRLLSVRRQLERREF